MTETPLGRMLAERHPRPDAMAAFRVARHAFLAGRHLEMQELAAQLGVSRATIFRWVGSRDQLLSEVVWSVTEPTWHKSVAAAGAQQGGKLLVKSVTGFAAATIASSPFMDFVRREPERALRLLTTRAFGFQRRLLAAFEQLVSREVDAGRLEPPMPVHDLANLMLRITESFVYSDVIAGEIPDPGEVQQALGALLQV